MFLLLVCKWRTVDVKTLVSGNLKLQKLLLKVRSIITVMRENTQKTTVIDSLQLVAWGIVVFAPGAYMQYTCTTHTTHSTLKIKLLKNISKNNFSKTHVKN